MAVSDAQAAALAALHRTALRRLVSVSGDSLRFAQSQPDLFARVFLQELGFAGATEAAGTCLLHALLMEGGHHLDYAAWGLPVPLLAHPGVPKATLLRVAAALLDTNGAARDMARETRLLLALLASEGHLWQRREDWMDRFLLQLLEQGVATAEQLEARIRLHPCLVKMRLRWLEEQNRAGRVVSSDDETLAWRAVF